jgi:hypothetical protein
MVVCREVLSLFTECDARIYLPEVEALLADTRR